MARHHRTTHIMSNSSADELFSLGYILHLSLTINQAIIECKASVLKPFLSFTKSQALLVELQAPISGIPVNVVLNIYGPRLSMIVTEYQTTFPTVYGHCPLKPQQLSDVKPLLPTSVSMITTRIIGSTLTSCSGKKFSAGRLKTGLTLS